MTAGSGSASTPPVTALNLRESVDELIPYRLDRMAASAGPRTAMVCGAASIDWTTLAQRMKAVSRGLRRLGCEPGGRVGILSENSIDYAVVIAGAIHAGAVVVPLPCLASEETLAKLASDAGLVGLVASSRYRDSARAMAGASANLLAQGLIAMDFEADGWLPLGRLEAAGEGGELAAMRRLNPDDPLNIIYSSGTTGVPKGIVHTQGARATQSASFCDLDFDEGSVALITTPLYSNFSFGGLLVALWAGATAILIGKFEEAEFLEICRTRRPTHVFLVPVQLERLLRHPDFDVCVVGRPALKYLAGSPMREQTKRECLDRWPGPLVEVYGMTEGGAVTVLFAHNHPDKLASVGRPVGGGELLILGEHDAVLGPGEIGEIVGRAGPAMAGYHNRAEASEAIVWRAPNGAEYLRSGDLGYLDEDGFLYLSGRKKDVIISGGFNIYADDLEEVIARHPAVLEVAVIGAPSEQFGETPLALVVRAGGETISEDELRSWANEHLGKTQRLSAVEFRATLPRGPIGKVLKAELRTAYWPQQQPARERNPG